MDVAGRSFVSSPIERFPELDVANVEIDFFVGDQFSLECLRDVADERVDGVWFDEIIEEGFDRGDPIDVKIDTFWEVDFHFQLGFVHAMLNDDVELFAIDAEVGEVHDFKDAVDVDASAARFVTDFDRSRFELGLFINEAFGEVLLVATVM